MSQNPTSKQSNAPSAPRAETHPEQTPVSKPWRARCGALPGANLARVRAELAESIEKRQDASK